MSWIQRITTENFRESFHLTAILTNSIFYPDCGCDGSDVELFAGPIVSFIHCDEKTNEEEVESALLNDFEPVGYDLVGIQKINLAGFRFAFWAVFSLRSDARHYSDGKQKASSFSILHVCGPHKIVFTYLYEMNSIYPVGVFEKTRS